MIFPRSAKFSEKVEKSKGGPLKSEIFDHFEDRVFIKNPEISEFANLEGMGTGDRGPGTGDRGQGTRDLSPYPRKVGKVAKIARSEISAFWVTNLSSK